MFSIHPLFFARRIFTYIYICMRILCIEHIFDRSFYYRSNNSIDICARKFFYFSNKLIFFKILYLFSISVNIFRFKNKLNVRSLHENFSNFRDIFIILSFHNCIIIMSTHILENYFNFLNGSASLYSIWILPALNPSTSVPATPVREMQNRNTAMYFKCTI